MRLTRWATLAGTVLGLTILPSCDSSTAPLVTGGRASAAVIATDANNLSDIDLAFGIVGSEIGPLPQLKSRGTTSPDGSTFYFLALGLDNPTDEIVAIDTRSRRIEWKVDVAALQQLGLADSLSVSIGYAMTVTPDGSRLLIRSANNGVDGIAVMDLRSQAIVSFFPLAEINDLSTVPPNSDLPNGVILVAAVRQRSQFLFDGMFYVLDGASLAVRDSVVITPQIGDETGGMQQVLAAPDGRHAYVVGFEQFRYDLVNHRITDSVATPNPGWLSISPDGTTLYRSDAGGFDFPGTGKIFVYNADLIPRTPINVTAIAAWPGTAHEPIVTGNVIPSPDGKVLYVATGTPRGGGYGPEEPSRLLVIDLVKGTLLRGIRVRGSSPLLMFVR